ncbi:sensor histidine kinase [Candidatus Blastococcus massiliensis]|uniref:sensor histidine kinase n=1 Tax=Candidatus Blastococcus massiliensis TaxID=1470358 RepID=UPI0004B32CBB|nr:sensor histidine kinase [Candidatus Blastococcus massiliensis]
MPADVLIGIVLVAWLASGLAAVCLTPRNTAARTLLLAGLLLAASALADSLAADPDVGDLPFALLRTAGWMSFLGAVAAIVATLARLPDGAADRPWHVRLAGGLAVLAVVAPLLELVGSESLAVDEDGVVHANPLAVDALEPLAGLGAAVRVTEPAWVLLGVAVLVLRWRSGDAERRRELSWAIRSIALLACLLLLIVVVEVSGLPIPPERVFVPLFLLALALFPLALLVGITRRVRVLEDHLVESRERLVSAEDAARRTLERDLHDGVQQQLVAALSLVALASRQASRRPEEARATVGEVGQRIQDAITELRELVRGLRPPVLADAGLVAAVESRLTGLPARVELETPLGPADRCAPAVEAAAYFVATEAVTNALKHAPGSRVVVRIDLVDDRLCLEVADDGPGLPDDPPAGPGPSGLSGLRDRVESLRGTFAVVRAPGGGTVLRASFPAGGR